MLCAIFRSKAIFWDKSLCFNESLLIYVENISTNIKFYCHLRYVTSALKNAISLAGPPTLIFTCEAIGNTERMAALTHGCSSAVWECWRGTIFPDLTLVTHTHPHTPITTWDAAGTSQTGHLTFWINFFFSMPELWPFFGALSETKMKILTQLLCLLLVYGGLAVPMLVR